MGLVMVHFKYGGVNAADSQHQGESGDTHQSKVLCVSPVLIK
ncbi:hypothetical protein QE357_001295 [Siphonobacter sp. BAB-5404]|nr:hypothetical protein [Siphonobacter sp. SORGH_AS_0500]